VRLISFSVYNYRSIEKAEDLAMGDLCVLVGPNNEGKSNLLHGLALALDYLSTGGDLGWMKKSMLGKMAYGRRSSLSEEAYVWERDYPQRKQAFSPSKQKPTQFTLTFTLDDTEKEAFEKAIHCALRTNLIVGVVFAKEAYPKFSASIQGRGKQKLIKNQTDVCTFISEHLMFHYIASDRTADTVAETVSDLFTNLLNEQLKNEPEYSAFRKVLDVKQREIEKSLGAALSKSVRRFVPGVRAVGLTYSPRRSEWPLEGRVDIQVDDGSLTELSLKGDGLKSLVAISVVRDTSVGTANGKGLVLAVEEPETHLHPGAVHEVRGALAEIARSHQVIYTTHSPILVDYTNPGNNIIVERGKARQAHFIKEVRESLGIRPYDNLTSAEVVLLVEGITDEKCIGKWICSLSPAVDAAMKGGRLAVVSMKGCAKLLYLTTRYQGFLCDEHVCLDNDDAARQQRRDAVASGLLDARKIVHLSVLKMPHSELEDLVLPACYEQQLIQVFGATLDNAARNDRSHKWSTRMEQLFTRCGLVWDEDTAEKLKEEVASCVITGSGETLWPERAEPIRTLVSQLEARLHK
jgi:putative ATP-dependent endonuclease of OLD family